MTPDQKKLRDFMSNLSEEAWCAGWLHGLEYILWRAVQMGPSERNRWFPPSDLDLLRKGAEEIGGWIVWGAADGTDTDEGNRFVPMDEWLRMFAEDEERERQTAERLAARAAQEE